MLKAEIPFDEIITQASAATGVPKDLLQGLIAQESGYNPHAISPKGAMGLTQLMPGTAAEMGMTNPYDPEQNIMGGARYLAMLLRATHGDVPGALAAYNEGLRNYQKGRMFPETMKYVPKVLGYQKAFRGSHTTHNNITQNIYGNDPIEVADRATRKMTLALQRTYPGTTAPVVG